MWGTEIVAVYMPDSITIFDVKKNAPGVPYETLYQEHKHTIFFYGIDELVVPPALMKDIILVRDVDDITMSTDPSKKIAKNDDPVSSVTKKGIE